MFHCLCRIYVISPQPTPFPTAYSTLEPSGGKAEKGAKSAKAITPAGPTHMPTPVSL